MVERGNRARFPGETLDVVALADDFRCRDFLARPGDPASDLLRRRLRACRPSGQAVAAILVRTPALPCLADNERPRSCRGGRGRHAAVRNVCRSRVRNRNAPPDRRGGPDTREAAAATKSRPGQVGSQLSWRVCHRIGDARRRVVCRRRPARRSRWPTASRRRAPFHRGTSATGPRSSIRCCSCGASPPGSILWNCADWPAASRRSGPQVGARHRAAREGRRLARSGGLMSVSIPWASTTRCVTRVENTRADFETAFTALAASAPAVIAASTVTSTADFAASGGRVIVSGVIQYRGDGPVMRPYLLAGSGRGGGLRRSRDADADRHLPLHATSVRQPSKRPTRCGSATRHPVRSCGSLAAA